MPVSQYQFNQHDRTTVEAKIVLLRRFAGGEEEVLRSHLQARLSDGMNIRLSVVDHIPRGEGGKYEDYVCKLPN